MPLYVFTFYWYTAVFSMLNSSSAFISHLISINISIFTSEGQGESMIDLWVYVREMEWCVEQQYLQQDKTEILPSTKELLIFRRVNTQMAPMVERKQKQLRHYPVTLFTSSEATFVCFDSRFPVVFLDIRSILNHMRSRLLLFPLHK